MKNKKFKIDFSKSQFECPQCKSWNTICTTKVDECMDCGWYETYP